MASKDQVDRDTSSIDGRFDDALKCVICQAVYHQPMILPCQHTFCDDCLKSLYTMNKEHRAWEVVCHICKKACFTVYIKQNEFLQSFVESQADMKEKTSSQLQLYMEEINDILQDLSNRIETKNKIVQQLEMCKKEMKNALDNVRKEVQARKEEIIEMVRKEFDALMDLIEVTEHSQVQMIDRYKSEQDSQAIQLKHFHQWGNAAFGTGTEKNIPVEHFFLGLERLRFFGYKGMNEDLVTLSKIQAKFTEAPNNESLGKMEFIKNLPTFYGTVENPRLMSEGSLSGLLGKFWKREQLWAYTGAQNIKLAIHDNCYWILNKATYSLVVNTFGGQPTSIPLNTALATTDVRSFVFTMYNELVVVAATGVFHLHPDGSLNSKIADGNYVDINVDGKFFHVLETNGQTIKTFKRTGGRWVLLHAEIVGVAQPTSMASANGVFYITSNNNVSRWQKGHAIQPFGASGGGQPGYLNCPRVCAVDKEGNVLVGDVSNGRLQVKNSKGRWSILQLELMDAPWDVFVEAEGCFHVYSQSYGVIRYSEDK